MPAVFTFTMDESFSPITRLFIHKAGVKKPRLVASFPHRSMANRFKTKLEKYWHRELGDIWSEAVE